MLPDLIPQARYCAPPPFALRKQKETSAQAEGRRYEAKAIVFFSAWALKNKYDYKVKPWIEYDGLDNRKHYCQPDFLAFSRDNDNLLLLEFKLRHCREAFDQLRRYRDMLLSLHPTFTPNLVEICRYFDPDVLKVALISELRPHSHPFAALIWEPQSPLCLTLN